MLAVSIKLLSPLPEYFSENIFVQGVKCYVSSWLKWSPSIPLAPWLKKQNLAPLPVHGTLCSAEGHGKEDLLLCSCLQVLLLFLCFLFLPCCAYTLFWNSYSSTLQAECLFVVGMQGSYSQSVSFCFGSFKRHEGGFTELFHGMNQNARREMAWKLTLKLHPWSEPQYYSCI